MIKTAASKSVRAVAILIVLAGYIAFAFAAEIEQADWNDCFNLQPDISRHVSKPFLLAVASAAEELFSKERLLQHLEAGWPILALAALLAITRNRIVIAVFVFLFVLTVILALPVNHDCDRKGGNDFIVFFLVWVQGAIAAVVLLSILLRRYWLSRKVRDQRSRDQ